MNLQPLHFRTFLVLLAAVSLAFAGLLQPYFGALFWGAVLAILFAPLHRRLLARMPARRNAAALLALAACVFVVLLPLALLAGSLVQEGAELYRRVATGQLDLARSAAQLIDALPPALREMLGVFDIVDIASLRQKVSEILLQTSRFLATQAFSAGQSTLEFAINLGIMLYLLFFLLRDGAQLARHCTARIPLEQTHQRQLLHKFATVARATVKGNLVIAALQGVAGGVIFWILGIEGALLWGVLMAVLSLLPAVGAALVWLPAAVWFLATGALASGIVLMLYGVFVISLLDNLLRPMLVGKDTKLPDWLVLISTLGGLSLFGLHGFIAGPLVAALFITCWDMFPAFIPRHPDQTESTDSPPAPAPTATNAAIPGPPHTPPHSPDAATAR